MLEIWNLFAIFGCVIDGLDVVMVLVLLLVPLLKLLYSLSYMLCICFHLILIVSVAVDYYDLTFCSIYLRSLSNWGMNISQSKLKGSNCVLCLLLICIASFPTYFISLSCPFLMLTGSAKLILPMWLLSAILTAKVFCISISFWGIICWMWCITNICRCHLCEVATVFINTDLPKIIWTTWTY